MLRFSARILGNFSVAIATAIKKKRQRCLELLCFELLCLYSLFYMSWSSKLPPERLTFRAVITECNALLHGRLLTGLFLLPLGPIGGGEGRRWCHAGGQSSVPSVWKQAETDPLHLTVPLQLKPQAFFPVLPLTLSETCVTYSNGWNAFMLIAAHFVFLVLKLVFQAFIKVYFVFLS